MCSNDNMYHTSRKGEFCVGFKFGQSLMCLGTQRGSNYERGSDTLGPILGPELCV